LSVQNVEITYSLLSVSQFVFNNSLKYKEIHFMAWYVLVVG
jgi:hypothetical protein